jgi:hypothetical protein
MLTICWAWLICGVLLVPAVWLLLDDVLSMSAAAGQAPEIQSVLKLVVLALGVGVGILLPGVFIYIYRDHDLRLTCEAHDPRPGWADRCSGPVLGLSLSLAALAVLAVPLALTPAVPLFGLLVTGWPGAGLTLLMGLFALYLARSLYRRELIGWWGTALLLLLAGLSSWLTFSSDANLEVLFTTLGYDEEYAAALLPASRLIVLWGSIPVTLGSLSYLGCVRKHFAATSHPTATERGETGSVRR